MGELKKMYDKYKLLQDKLKSLLIRAKEGSRNDGVTDRDDAIVVDMSGEMKISGFVVNDTSLLSVDQKNMLESLVVKAFQKAQNKAQQIVAEKTKEILGFDPSDIGKMMGGGGINIPGLS